MWRVVADHGFAGASLRHVAAEADVSMGLVQHYFRTKEEMLGFAMAAVAQRVEKTFAAGPRRAPGTAGTARRGPRAARAVPAARRRAAPRGRRDVAFMAEGVRGGPIGEWMRDGMAQLRT